MDYSGASAYTYAKMSGKLPNLLIGKNALKLFNAKSLAEIWDSLFTVPMPHLPESLLANKIESEALGNFIDEYKKMLSNYTHPNVFLLAFLSKYELENLKVISASLSQNQTEIPNITELGEYSYLNYKAWPDIKKITEKTRFSWYDRVPSEEEKFDFDFRLDLEQIRFVWSSVNKVSDSSKQVLVEYYKNLFSIKNMLWALRLRVYYNMDSEVIKKKLFYVSSEPSKKDPICKYAYEILLKEVDNYEDWKKWRFASFLNFHEDGEVWRIDPVWIEQKFRFGEAKRAKRIFHENPMTFASFVMFFILKQHELDCIRAATEAVRLNASKSDAMFASGIESEEF